MMLSFNMSILFLSRAAEWRRANLALYFRPGISSCTMLSRIESARSGSLFRSLSASSSILSVPALWQEAVVKSKYMLANREVLVNIVSIKVLACYEIRIFAINMQCFPLFVAHGFHGRINGQICIKEEAGLMNPSIRLLRDPNRIQTCNLLIRSQMLYSVELWGRFKVYRNLLF